MNKHSIIVLVVVLVILGAFLYSRNVTAPEPEPQASIAGCYVAHLAKDVYTLKVEVQTNEQISGKLSFKNFQKDSSSGTFVGTYKDGILLGDYSFSSEGMNSVMQVIFKKSGGTFVRGFGEMNATGDRFADVNKITFDSNQTFAPSADCPI